MHVSEIEEHYRLNFNKFVKKMRFRAGTQEAGEDIVQTAYERALLYAKNCEPNRFGQWFSRILNNSFIDHMNAERGYAPVDAEAEEEMIDCNSYPSHIVREIYELISTKSEAQIEVLTLHLKHGYSATDIHRQTDYSYAKCHQIIQRFRNELIELYK